MRTYNTLMIQSRTPPTFWTMNDAVEALGHKTVMPPLGLITIAGMLPEHYHAKIVDLNVTDLDDQDLENADLVLITGMHIQWESFRDVVKRAHQLGKTIVVGGPLAIAEYESYSAQEPRLTQSENIDEKIDHWVLYEAEINLPAFLKDYENGRSPTNRFLAAEG